MRMKINVENVEIGKTKNSNFSGDVVIFTFGQSVMGVSGQNGSFFWTNSTQAYNDFVGSVEFKSLHPDVLMIYSDSSRTEFSSNKLKPNEIVALLQEKFDSPALDAANLKAKTLDGTF
ncbi:Uncharacterised protein [Legionella steigerwaltii]|uniref:Uncharacterized protein n=1 Tax=Legionella steigerwaltii TaxID=460 RepID=A0A378L8Y6_9GAMM|nr:hypothetical protein [Legionella steigerwaltii]KTD76656.1 hypothetical protein Lstg_2292 [Legionella steigerwaltii]STY22800.1 Uncharacterised protein [Legionella steigerwaltii]